jgi:hypothetical protein
MGEKMTLPRFFIDHTMIHDRVTGKHVTCDPDFRDYIINPGEITRINNPDGISNTCALLNSLATPAQTVDVEAVREVIAVLRKCGWIEDADKLAQAVGDNAIVTKGMTVALRNDGRFVIRSAKPDTLAGWIDNPHPIELVGGMYEIVIPEARDFG